MYAKKNTEARTSGFGFMELVKSFRIPEHFSKEMFLYRTNSEYDINGPGGRLVISAGCPGSSITYICSILQMEKG